MKDLSAFMHLELARNGIVLDPVKPSRYAAAPATKYTADRDAIRAALVARGVPERDLEWMVNSCPSLAAAVAHKERSL